MRGVVVKCSRERVRLATDEERIEERLSLFPHVFFSLILTTPLSNLPGAATRMVFDEDADAYVEQLKSSSNQPVPDDTVSDRHMTS